MLKAYNIAGNKGLLLYETSMITCYEFSSAYFMLRGKMFWDFSYSAWRRIWFIIIQQQDIEVVMLCYTKLLN